MLFGRNERRNPGFSRIIASHHVDDRFLVDARAVATVFSTTIRGVPVHVSLVDAKESGHSHAYSVVESLNERVSPDFIPLTTVVARRPIPEAYKASFDFYVDIALSERVDSYNIDDLDRAASAVVDVGEISEWWAFRVWEWITVLGGRVQEPFHVQAFYPRAHVTLHDGTTTNYYSHPPEDDEPPRRAPLSARRMLPITVATLQDIFDRIEAGEAAPVAPLLLFNAVEHMRNGDPRTAMVIGGGALDLILDERWDAAGQRDESLGPSSGTLGFKLKTMEKKGIALPLGISADEIQERVVRVRNAAAHGDVLSDDEVLAALLTLVDAARELWPEQRWRDDVEAENDEPWIHAGPNPPGMFTVTLTDKDDPGKKATVVVNLPPHT